EIAACEPYFIGSHSGGSGAWVSGPEDLETPYKWGYGNMTTVQGLFSAGDGTGASSHKFSSGSHAEGRYAGKQAIRFILDNNSQPSVGDTEALKTACLAPMARFEANKGMTTDPEINPNYIRPMSFMFRLQKIMDEYAGGVVSAFKTSKALLERGLELLDMLKEDAQKLGAEDSYELERCWENTHRMWQAEAHVRTILFREETRWPGYYFRADKPTMDEANWKCFVNCTFKDGEWKFEKKEVVDLIG
ncbi:MAG: adenylylsulfate reductase subunit alpha, partial [Proteobacteria bacterium]|nr:adenylylsulfate reductase subunit alpha [Pseudomonadota bacterium]